MCSTQRCPECDYPKCEGGHTKPDTSPLRTPWNGAIIVDGTQRKLDTARALYRKRYNEGYSLSEQGFSEAAQNVLDRANAALRVAEEEYAAARARGGRTQ